MTSLSTKPFEPTSKTRQALMGTCVVAGVGIAATIFTRRLHVAAPTEMLVRTGFAQASPKVGKVLWQGPFQRIQRVSTKPRLHTLLHTNDVEGKSKGVECASAAIQGHYTVSIAQAERVVSAFETPTDVFEHASSVVQQTAEEYIHSRTAADSRVREQGDFSRMFSSAITKRLEPLGLQVTNAWFNQPHTDRLLKADDAPVADRVLPVASQKEELCSNAANATASNVVQSSDLADAHYRKAQDHIYGRGGCVKDVRKGAELLKQAAEMGHLRAMLERGMCLYHGLYFAKIDKGTGMGSILRAAEAGEQLAVAMCSLQEWGSFKRDNFRLRDNLHSMDKSDPWVMYALAHAYRGIRATDQERVTAAKWFWRAANAGHALSQTELAWCYICGSSVQSDSKRAFVLYELAADQGYANAHYLVGECYEKAYNREKAVEYYKLAHAQGCKHMTNSDLRKEVLLP